MSSTTITPISMNLTGQYASSFQAILNKAVQTATVPLTLVEHRDTAIVAQKSALGTLQSAVAAVTSSLTALGNDGSSGALGATSSNTAAVTVSNSGATSPASYTINSVTSVATTASETSLVGYGDSAATPVSTTGAMQLMVGTTPYNFTLTNNNLSGLVSQINGLKAGVTASILTTAGGNYLSLTANATGATTVQLNDDPTGVNNNVISSTNQGTNAVFHLNGIMISQPSNTINNVISGLTFNIAGATASPVTMTLASDSSQLSTDLQTFATNYNALAKAVQAQTGQSGGALVGNSVIRQLQQTMHQLNSYFSSTGGGVQSLADLGISFNNGTGLATFSPGAISSMGTSQLSDALKFLGSKTTGLGKFSQTFSQLSDPISGAIQTAIQGATTADTHLQSQIATLVAQVTAFQANEAKRIEQADALEAAFETQQTQLTSSLQGLSLVLYGKSAGSPGS